MNFIVVAFVVAFAAFYILAPLRRAPLRRASLDNRDIEYSMSSAVEAERAQNALSQAELDLSLGKINDDEYRELQARHAPRVPDSEIKNQDVVLLNQLPNQLRNESATESDADADIEAEILIARARRKPEATHNAAATTDWSCPQCQRAMSAQDRFCASCGAARLSQPIAVR